MHGTSFLCSALTASINVLDLISVLQWEAIYAIQMENSGIISENVPWILESENAGQFVGSANGYTKRRKSHMGPPNRERNRAKLPKDRVEWGS